MRMSSLLLVAGLLGIFLPLHACTDRDPLWPEPDPDLPDFSGTCESAGGTVHSGTVSGTWTRNQSPHRVADTVYVRGELVLEAGALVCLGPDAAISWRPGQEGTVLALGTAEAPVVFTADRPGGRWGGFVFDDPGETWALVDLTHVVIENANVGIRLDYYGGARLTDSIIRRMTGPGVYAGGIWLRRVVVDSVCGGGAGWAVSGPPYAGVHLEDVWVRDSGGGGVAVYDRASLTLANVRITGSAGLGLSVNWLFPPDRYGVLGPVVHPIHITGGHSRPAWLPADIVPDLLPSLEAQERWTGNAEDVIGVYNTASLGELVVGPGLAWSLYPGEWPGDGPSVAHLRMLPGARFSGGRAERITAAGTADDPVVIRGTSISGSELGPSTIAHGRLHEVSIASGEAHALELRDVVLEKGYVSLDAREARLERVLVRGVLDPWPEWPHLPRFAEGATPTEAVRIAAADVLISGSEISHSPSDGLRVEVATHVRVRDSNIRYNGGVGLRNVAAEAVDARNNWWGDPAGPTGPHGNGVSGAVDYEPFQTEPVVLDGVASGPLAGAITLAPSTAQIPAGDTAHFSAVVFDPSGAPLLSERIVWRSSDTTVAAVAPIGLVTGVRPGEATITAEAVSDTTVRAAAAVHVTPGAPLYEWTRYDLAPSGGCWGWSTGIWGSEDAGTFVAGYGVVHRFDGAVWHETQIAPNTQLFGLSGSAPDHLWIIGMNYDQEPPRSVVFRYDGTSWHSVSLPPSPLIHLYHVWVAAPDRVFLGGRTYEESLYSLWLYDGTSLQQQLEDGFTGTLWGRSRGEVFAATAGGTLRYDGETWTAIGGPTHATAYWGTATELFVLRGEGFSRYDGTGWQTLPSLPPGTYLDMAGTAGSGIFAAGRDGAVAYYDGTRWWTMWLGTAEPNFCRMAVVGENVYLVAWNEVFRGRSR